MSVVTAKRISQVSGPQPDTVQSSLTQLSARESRREDVGEATAHAARTRRRRNTAHAVTASESRHTGHGHTVISLHDPIAYCKCSTTLRTRWNQSVPPCETRRAHCVTRARLSPNAHRGLSGPPELAGVEGVLGAWYLRSVCVVPFFQVSLFQVPRIRL